MSLETIKNKIKDTLW